MIYVLIFVLTIADATCTVWGVMSKQITEANPLIAWAMHRWPIITGIVIVIAVGVALLFMAKQKIKWLGYAAGGLLAVKIVIVFMHISWMGG